MDKRVKLVGMAMGLLLTLGMASTAQADNISVGSSVTFADGPGNVAGAFYLTPDGNAADRFMTFCIQMSVDSDLSEAFRVDNISSFAFEDPADKGGDINGRDYLSSETAWLYTQLRSGAFGDPNAMSDDTANAFQWAFWVLEGENNEVPWGSFHDLADSFILAARQAVANGSWSGIGNVRVLNLVTADGGEAQDQLVLINTPEPASLALIASGAVALYFRRRRSATLS